jgi:hypothetical protein
MTEKWWIGEDYAASIRDIIKKLYWFLLWGGGGVEWTKTTKIVSKDIQSPGRISNRGSTEHDSTALPLS